MKTFVLITSIFLTVFFTVDAKAQMKQEALNKNPEIKSVEVDTEKKSIQSIPPIKEIKPESLNSQNIEQLNQKKMEMERVELQREERRRGGGLLLIAAVVVIIIILV